MKPYVIAFANQKGGVGKTTSAVNIASIIAEMGKKVVLLDCDPQGNSTSGLGQNKKKLRESMYDALTDGLGPDKCVVQTRYDNLWLVPATMALAGAEIELADASGREKRLRDFVEKLDGYDIAIIDCPPSLGMLTVNGLTAADGVVIPMQCEYYALEGLTQLMISIKKVKQLYNPDLTITGILITMHNGRLNLSSQVLSEIKKYYSDKLFSTVIPRNVTLSEAPGYGEPINHYDRHSKGAAAYREVAEELLKRCPV
ncbi:MAG: ParA family protein [Clostridia bacterium]|nr:ParA family protein [Clostridia bacterium]MBR3990825.1 ParA family protein [Clostridia bacterium]MBR6290124.1 ParA family protein [Clostridia bacterium]